MKEIIKVERFLEAIKNSVWSRTYLDIAMAQKYYFSYRSDFGDYPDIVSFEAELLTVDKNLIEDKIKSINQKCDELIKVYETTVSKIPISKGTMAIGKWEAKVNDITVDKFGNASVKIDLAETRESSKHKKIYFSNSDLIGTIKNIKSIVKNLAKEKEKPEMDLSKFDNLFISTITDRRIKDFKDDIKKFVPEYKKYQIVALASIIYPLLHKNVKPKDFTVWLQMFSRFVGVETPKAKQGNKSVKESIPEMKKAFYYLFLNQ